jgi:hypothetical protein
MVKFHQHNAKRHKWTTDEIKVFMISVTAPTLCSELNPSIILYRREEMS